MVLLLTLLIGGMRGYSAVYNGNCGPTGNENNVKWSLNTEDSTLTITGSGKMKDFGTTSQPWYKYRDFIKHVVIGEGVTTIGNYAFYQFQNLVSVTNPSTLLSIRQQACYRCHALETFNFPEGLEEIGTNSGGHGPFYECTSLKAIYIPASVKKIYEDAFLRCSSATSIIVHPDNTKYDSHDNCNAIIETSTKTLWYGCRNSVIPDGVVTVKDWAFEYQHNLRSIRISSTVKNFGTISLSGGVFKECENLKDIYVEWTSNIPNWHYLTRWYEHSNLDATIRLHVPCGKKSFYQGISGWNNYQIIDDHRTGGICGAQGSNLTWMLDCSGKLTIKGLGEMKDYTAGTAPWYAYKEEIDTIYLDEQITSIGEYAFAGLSHLEDIFAPWTENIPAMPASNTPQSATKLHVPCSAISTYETMDGWKDYTAVAEYLASGTCGPEGHESDVIWTLCDSTLTISGTGPMHKRSDGNEDFGYFSYRSAIKKVIFGSGVTFIGIHTLSRLYNLEYIEVEDGNPVYDSRDNCNALIHTATNTIVFGAAKTVIPSSVRALRAYAFANLDKITSITIPETVESVGNEAFISSAEGYYSYQHKDKGLVFLNCTALKDIYVEWTETEAIPEWIKMTVNWSFAPLPGITLHVPCGTKSLYEAKDGWKDYTIPLETKDVTVWTEDNQKGLVGIEEK